ncbi:MAG: hypothetical protein H6993_04070 [Pseudomonadales bacterium]|nr:hypothetical protein [Pseudomonadales bacterium]
MHEATTDATTRCSRLPVWLAPTALTASLYRDHPDNAMGTPIFRTPTPFTAIALSTALLSVLPMYVAALDIVRTPDPDWRAYDAPVRIDLRYAAAEASALRVMAGSTDITAAVTMLPGGMVFTPSAAGLPAGEMDLVLYLADSLEQWSEKARFPIRILTRRGFSRIQASPNLQVENRGQLRERAYGSASPSSPSTYQTGAMQGGLAVQLERGRWSLDAQASIVGTTRREEALRFGVDDDAPRIDLAEYLVELVHDDTTRIGVGHLNFGSHRLLADNLAHRGIRISTTLVPGQEITLVALRGNAIVGYDHLLGISRSEHRIYGASWGWSPFPDNPALPHVEVSYTDASVLPEADFDSGQVRDAERSQGWGLRLAASTPSLEYDLLAARSRYRNPSDPLLGGAEILAVRAETADAAAARVLWRWSANPWNSASWPLNAELEGTWDYTEPLYRTVGAYVQPDQRTTGGMLRLGAGDVRLQLGLRGSRDNLDDLPSLLTTRTRDIALSLDVPLTRIAGEAVGRWLPDLSAGWQRVRQKAGNVPDPVLSGFSASHLPNQHTVMWNTQAVWYRDRIDFSVNFNGSRQDNRQPGRERADFNNRDLATALNWRPVTSLSLGLTAGRNWNRERETGLQRRTRSYGINAAWQVTEALNLSASVFDQRQIDSRNNERAHDRTADAQASWSFSWRPVAGQELPGQLFLRWGLQQTLFADRFFGFSNRGRTWVVNSGFSLTVF